MVGYKGWSRQVLSAVLVLGAVHNLQAQDGNDSKRPGGNRGGFMPGGMRPGGNAANSGNTATPTDPAQLLRSGVTTDSTGSEVAVNWENITLKDCIEVLCRDLGMEFIISPSVNVTQEVSIRAGDVTEWERADKLEMFDAILETAGVQRLERGRVWVFSPSDLRPIVKAGEETEYSAGKPIIGVIQLQNIDASTAQDFLNNFTGKPQRIYGMKGSSILIVLGTQGFLQQMQELLEIVDVPSSVLIQHVLKVADASDVSEELSNVFYRRTGADGNAVQFFPIARLNMVVAHNATPAMVKEIEHWITMLDRADGLNNRTTKIYRLKVVEAETIGKTLSDLYSSLYAQSLEREKELGKTSTKKSNSKNNTAKNSNTAKTNNKSNTAAKKQANTTQAAAADPGGAAAGTSVDEEVIILSDEDTNTLIVNAPADMQKEIAKTIDELDRSRRQVLIETAMVEVVLDEGTDFGVEWAVQGSDPTQIGAQGTGLAIDDLVTGTAALPGVTDGFTYFINSNNKKWALIKAAQNDNRLQVISSPNVLTRDGMEAEISFGEEVPIQSSSLTDGGNQNFSFDYRDAKITLTVTPHIDDNEMVTLNLEQEVRRVIEDSLAEAGSAPTFRTREIRSNLQVDNGQTVILGGLIEREDTTARVGIPYLMDIPLLGYLFGRNVQSKAGTEILMIMTPYVVDTRDETDLLTQDFRRKLLGSLNQSSEDIRSVYQLQEEPAEEQAEEE